MKTRTSATAAVCVFAAMMCVPGTAEDIVGGEQADQRRIPPFPMIVHLNVPFAHVLSSESRSTERRRHALMAPLSRKPLPYPCGWQVREVTDPKC
jgi:hypothetical protein